MPRLKLKRGKSKPIWHGHPWVYAQAVAEKPEADSGALVEVVDHEGKAIGEGFYHASSAIACRLVSRGSDRVDDEARWFSGRLTRARELRRRLGFPDQQTDCYRLVNSEGDGLPGLVVDAYHQTLAVQFGTLAMYQRASMIIDALSELFPNHAIVEVGAGAFAKREGFVSTPGIRRGDSAVADCREHGIAYRVDLLKGQKTGLYLDQRENHALLRQFCFGARVLDLYSYAGGFALNALYAGAERVVAVDCSENAVAMIACNTELNSDPAFAADRAFAAGRRVETVCEDVFRFLNGVDRGAFDVVVCDPPKFAHSREGVRGALKGYRKLFRQALQTLRPGGILAAACCSQLVDWRSFVRELSGAGLEQGRDLHLLHRGRTGMDHPLPLAFEEGNYLKFVVCLTS